MQLREDSPFKNMTEETKAYVRDYIDEFGFETMREELSKEGIDCSIPALRRFVRRLREEQMMEEAEEGADVIEKFAARAKDSKSMEATLEATRQRFFEYALETNDRASLVAMFKVLNEEKAQARMAAVEERKAKAAEENAKIGWRKLELQEAQSALRLLPQIRETLMDGTISAEEKVGRALHCLMERGGKLLLTAGESGKA